MPAVFRLEALAQAGRKTPWDSTAIQMFFCVSVVICTMGWVMHKLS